jgi:hypothetical protein
MAISVPAGVADLLALFAVGLSASSARGVLVAAAIAIGVALRLIFSIARRSGAEIGLGGMHGSRNMAKFDGGTRPRVHHRWAAEVSPAAPTLWASATKHSWSATSAPVETRFALPVTGFQSSALGAVRLLAARRSLYGSAGIIIGTMLPESAGTLIGGVGRRLGVSGGAR